MEGAKNKQADNPNRQNAPEDLAENAKYLGINIKEFFRGLLDIKTDSDRESTVEAIKKDISFKGHNAWILIFSIFVASIGLNISSTAVVIGAMLISPLMGPIVGVGMSVAINDVDTLKRSMLNLGVMVGLSVLTAYIYFVISPVKEATPELVSRTYPTLLDVMVAIFGGLALIVAKTKKGTIASVILGVAIATALMPPLCTVGYGLAIANWEYAGGALYLFSINAVFIALSTFVVAKLLGFPLVRYANSKRRRQIAQIASAIAIVVMIPSVYLFYKLTAKQFYETSVNNFLGETVQFAGTETLKIKSDYNSKEIDVYLIGKSVPSGTVDTWKQRMGGIKALKESQLTIHQGAGQTQDINILSSRVKSGILEDLYVKNQEALENKDKQIELLESELSKYQGNTFSFQNLSKEVKINYEDIEEIGYSNLISTNFNKTDTVPTFTVTWNSKLKNTQIQQQQEKFTKWLKVRLDLDTLSVKNVR